MAGTGRTGTDVCCGQWRSLRCRGASVKWTVSFCKRQKIWSDFCLAFNGHWRSSRIQGITRKHDAKRDHTESLTLYWRENRAICSHLPMKRRCYNICSVPGWGSAAGCGKSCRWRGGDTHGPMGEHSRLYRTVWGIIGATEEGACACVCVVTRLITQLQCRQFCFMTVYYLEKFIKLI